MKVLCVDDHPLFRDGLTLLMSRYRADLQFLLCDSCEQGLVLAMQHPDISLILLDVVLPHGISGMDAIPVFRSDVPSAPVVMLSSEDDPDIVLECIDRGAMGYIPKSSTSEDLMRAVDLVLNGQPYVPTSAIRRLGGDINLGTSSAIAAMRASIHLTAREEEVLSLLMRGLRNKMIADELGISSEGTVKQHVSSVLAKMKVRTRTEAVIKAVQLGLRPGYQ